MGTHSEADLVPVGGGSFWLLGLLRSVLTVLGTVRPAEDLEQSPGIWQQEVKNGESGYLFFTLVVRLRFYMMLRTLHFLSFHSNISDTYPIIVSHASCPNMLLS